jgi:pyruvate/oxaloacetate carboxyltransferase
MRRQSQPCRPLNRPTIKGGSLPLVPQCLNIAPLGVAEKISNIQDRTSQMTDNKLAITDLVLRDAHQSLFATRMRVEDMLPIAAQLDDIGFWSLETWGGATFDACIRYLGEDPWERLRLLKAAMPKTRMQMLFRGQNILGYRHYADDVVERFVERAADNGMDVFRIFDAMNDLRNFRTAVAATLRSENMPRERCPTP